MPDHHPSMSFAVIYKHSCLHLSVGVPTVVIPSTNVIVFISLVVLSYLLLLVDRNRPQRHPYRARHACRITDNPGRD